MDEQRKQHSENIKKIDAKHFAEISALKDTINLKDEQAFQKQKDHIAAINALNDAHAKRQNQYVI